MGNTDNTPQAHTSESLRFVGIDVSKDHLDIAITDGATATAEHFRIAYTDEPLAALATRLGGATLVVMEATGGYEHLAAAMLASAGLPVAVVNPRQVRDFARARGVLAKTDQIDALVLAHFASAMRPSVRPIPDAAADELTALVARRRQLVAMRAGERTRLGQARTARVRASVAAVIAFLSEQIDQTNDLVRACIEASPLWRAETDLLESVPGIGPVVAATLVAELPELGRLGPRALASLVGVAPHALESGRWRGQRHVWGGRAEVRRALYQAVLTGSRHNVVIKAIYERMVSAGKAKKVALVACMRRLLGWLSAMVKGGQRWDAERFAATP